MILWCDGAHGARENMRRDARLLERAAAGQATGPVLRLFGFAPPGITLGRSQDPARELDLGRMAAEGGATEVNIIGAVGSILLKRPRSEFVPNCSHSRLL